MQDKERLLNTLLDLVGDLEEWQLCFICPKCEIALRGRFDTCPNCGCPKDLFTQKYVRYKRTPKKTVWWNPFTWWGYYWKREIMELEDALW